MVHNSFVKCEVCNSITRIRLQVGFQEQHPIVVTCGKCGVSLFGKVFIGQEGPELKFEFNNAEILDWSDNPDYVVECSGEFPTRKMCSGGSLKEADITPFIRYQQRSGDANNYEKFEKSIFTMNQTRKRWPQYKRILELSRVGNEKYLIQELNKLFPEEIIQCRNELEVLRGVRMVEVHAFLAPLKSDISDISKIGCGILKLDKEQMETLINFLNSHSGYSLKELQEIINKMLEEFVDVFPYLIPAFSLQYCDKNAVDFNVEGTSTSTYTDIKQFYLDVYEALGNLLVLPVAIDNIRTRKDMNLFEKNDINAISLEKFIGLTKAKRFHLCSSEDIYLKTLDVQFNQKLRNAIGHNDVEYDTISQKITYIPNPKDRTKKLDEYLLKFEIEAIKMFQSVLVISEYLYRLRELELIYKGVIPLKVDMPHLNRKKIGRNEKCPCGSGLKYKFCHGKLK